MFLGTSAKRGRGGEVAIAIGDAGKGVALRG